MRTDVLLERLQRGELANVPFADLHKLVEALGFQLDRVRGSHQVYRHAPLRLRIVLQSRRGEAKPYQLRQLMEMVRVYNLRLGETR